MTIKQQRAEIAAILNDTDAEHYAHELTKIQSDFAINSMYNMIVIAKAAKEIRSSISRKLQFDIMCCINGVAKDMICLQPPFVNPSIYENLKAHPDKDFVAGDMVTWTDEKGQHFAVLQYSPAVAAFVLNKYTDVSFTKKVIATKETASVDFLFEVGFEMLVKIPNV